MKNLADNDISIFLYQFVLSGNGINFVLNEMIANDMTPDIDKKLKPYVQVCSETLLRYKHLCPGKIIMDGNILVTGEFEVMLSRGLGQYFEYDEKTRLFDDAGKIADLLVQVMSENGSKQNRNANTPLDTKLALEELGKEQRLESELQSVLEGEKIRPGLKQMRPEDLPKGVITSVGYDHRGTCYSFEHDDLGELGKIVLIKQPNGQTLLQADLFYRSSTLNLEKKKAIFEKVVAAISNHFDEQFAN